MNNNIFALFPNVVRSGEQEPALLLGALFVPGIGVTRNMCFARKADGVHLDELIITHDVPRTESSVLGDWKSALMWIQTTCTNSGVGELVAMRNEPLTRFYADLVRRIGVPLQIRDFSEVSRALEMIARQHRLCQFLTGAWGARHGAHWILAKHLLLERA